MLIVAIADFQHAVDQVPTLPEPCPGCDVEVRNAAVSERLDRLLELEDEYERRLTGYSVAILLIGIVFLVLRLRGLPRGEEREAFTELGIAGVVWLLIVVLLGLATSDASDPLEPSIGAPLAAGGALLLIAAIGSVATRSRSSAGLEEPASGLPAAVLVGAVLALGSLIASTRRVRRQGRLRGGASRVAGYGIHDRVRPRWRRRTVRVRSPSFSAAGSRRCC